MDKSFLLVICLVLLYFPDKAWQCSKNKKFKADYFFKYKYVSPLRDVPSRPVVQPLRISAPEYFPLEPLAVFNSFRDENGQNPIVIALANAPGCFIFSSSKFAIQQMSLNFQLFQEDQYAGKADTLSIDKCVRKCAEQRVFTYAGLQDGMNAANCYCFNDLDLLTPAACSGCMYYTGNATSGPPSIAVRRECQTDNIYRIYVQATCPYGFYTPPLCLDRAKDTCATVRGMPLTNSYGKCTRCGITKNSGIFFEILDYCDVLRDGYQIEDYRVYRMSLNPTSTNYDDGRKYLKWEYDMDSAPDLDPKTNVITEKLASINSPLLPLLNEGKHGNGINIIMKTPVMKTKPNLPANDQLFLDTSRRIYMVNIMLRARAAGAFFFSLWEDLGPKYYLSTDWGKTLPAFIQNIGKQKADTLRWLSYLQNSWSRFFKLQYKHLIDVDYDGTFNFNDINMILQPTESRKNLKLGWHTLDSKATWGGTGTLKENYDYSSLVCTTYYLYESNYQDTLSAFTVANMKNSWKRDKMIDGWKLGEVSVATVSHDMVMDPNPDWSADYSKSFQYENVIGVKGQYPYHEDCLFKVGFAIACPDNCIKQQCNTDGGCTQGCTTGYYGITCDMKCPSGKYGQNCASDCPSACASKICDRFSGFCTGGCAAGFSGPYCTPCSTGYYGGQCASACSTNCSMLTPTGLGVCDPATGYCKGGCSVGYQPPLCVLPCQNNTYGVNCVQKCGVCRGNECDHVTGVCRAGCAANYMNPTCKCVAGSWGEKCEKTCGTCRWKMPCNPKTGLCFDPRDMCEPNYQPPMCVCSLGKWGADCDKRCGNCYQGFCMSDTGECLNGCNPGFKGYFCDNKCDTDTWGPGCSGQCGKCIQSTCNPVDGKCATGCVKNYKVPMCTACADGFWGEGCSKECGHCRSGGICDANGICPYVPLPPSLLPPGKDIFEGVTTLQEAVEIAQSKAGLGNIDTLIVAVKYLCEPGFQPLTCICKTGFYGDLCSKPCTNCFIGCTDNGTCMGGCVPGFYGPDCSKPCPNGFFGPNCNFHCGNCFNNTGCTAETGSCKQGCDPGYMLPFCKCALGYFGDQCENKCGNCAVGTTCSFYSGRCESGCLPGWSEPYCNCTKGTYLLDCSGKCGHCSVGTDCDVETGECNSGCVPGYFLPFCNKICDPGKFGVGCVVDCGHCKDCRTCDQVTGNCPIGCDDGYKEPQCTQTCGPGTFGPNCQYKCGFCYNSTFCNPIDGVCDKGCATGYLSPYCTQACPMSTWGFNCQNTCGSCKNGTSCNYLDGKCAGGCLYAILKEPFCVLHVDALSAADVCPHGFYIPPSCSTRCGHCLAAVPCNGLLGFCTSGCMPGYKPLLCTETCDAGTYGANCLEICGKCSNNTNTTNTSCRNIDGVCINGCQKGWYGDTCKYTSQKEADRIKKNIVSRPTPSWAFTVYLVIGCMVRMAHP